MRQSREVKAETHQEIVAAASRLFRERGIEGTSVGDVMQAAQKTHGGFYRHFESKEALLVAALDDAFAAMLSHLEAGLAAVPRGETIGPFLDGYLAPELVEDIGGGCPVAALSGDVMRSPESVRSVFGAGTMKMIQAIAESLDGPQEDRIQKAAQSFSMAAGALMIARASDPQTAKIILDAARKGAARTPDFEPSIVLAAGVAPKS